MFVLQVEEKNEVYRYERLLYNAVVGLPGKLEYGNEA